MYEQEQIFITKRDGTKFQLYSRNQGPRSRRPVLERKQTSITNKTFRFNNYACILGVCSPVAKKRQFRRGGAKLWKTEFCELLGMEGSTKGWPLRCCGESVTGERRDLNGDYGGGPGGRLDNSWGLNGKRGEISRKEGRKEGKNERREEWGGDPKMQQSVQSGLEERIHLITFILFIF